MNKYYLINDGVSLTKHGDMCFFYDSVAELAIKNADEGIFFTYSGEDIKSKVEEFLLAKRFDRTLEIKRIINDLRYMYRVNAHDIEKQINLTKNIDLAELFGFTVANDKRTQHKPPLAVENDITPGDIIVTILAVFGAHNYNLECTQISESGDEDIVNIINVSNATAKLKGFVSGAKYSFRVQAVLTRNELTEFSESVTLRIN